MRERCESRREYFLGVSIGREVLVGIGAQVLPYLKIGNGATVGTGAVVTRDVPAGITGVGVPAVERKPKAY